MIWAKIWRHEAWLQVLPPTPAISLVQFSLPGWQQDGDLPLKKAGILHPKTESLFKRWGSDSKKKKRHNLWLLY